MNDHLSPFAWYDKDKVKESISTDMVSAAKGDSFGIGALYTINKSISALINVSNSHKDIMSPSFQSSLNPFETIGRIEMKF